MGYGWDGWGWGGWIVMVLLMALFWGAVVVGIVAIVRYGRGREQPPAPPPPGPAAYPPEHRGHPGHPGHEPEHGHEPSALDVLDERFARGEIDAEEYTRRRDLLRAGR